MGEGNMGTLYIGGEPVGELKELKMDVSLDDSKPMRVSATYSGSFTMKNIKINRLAMLSLIFGMRITNNWLKMHGGVMCRNGGKHRDGKR